MNDDKQGLTEEQLDEYRKVNLWGERMILQQRAKNNIIQRKFNAQAIIDIC